MLPVLGCLVANLMVLSQPVGQHVSPKLSKRHGGSGHHHPLQDLPGVGPSLPFYVILAPGDSLNGKIYSQTVYSGELPMNAGDAVVTGTDALGATIIHTSGTSSPHSFVILPNTQAVASGPDSGTDPGSVNCAYITVLPPPSMGVKFKLGKSSKSSLNAGPGPSGRAEKFASVPSTSRAASPTPASGNNPGVVATSGTVDASRSTTNTKVVVKTSGSTTVVSGSSFLVTLTSTYTVVDLYNFAAEVLVNLKGGATVTNASQASEYQVLPNGKILVVSPGQFSHSYAIRDRHPWHHKPKRKPKH